MDDERENGRAGATSKNGCKRTLSAYTRVPFIRALPPRALIIIGVLIGINIAVWIAVGIVSVSEHCLSLRIDLRFEILIVDSTSTRRPTPFSGNVSRNSLSDITGDWPVRPS